MALLVFASALLAFFAEPGSFRTETLTAHDVPDAALAALRDFGAILHLLDALILLWVPSGARLAGAFIEEVESAASTNALFVYVLTTVLTTALFSFLIENLASNTVAAFLLPVPELATAAHAPLRPTNIVQTVYFFRPAAL